MSNAFFVLSLLILFTGCVEVRSRSDEASKSKLEGKAAPNEAAIKAGVSWEFLPAAPDRYQVALKFPPGITVINRWVEGASSEMTKLSGTEDGAIVDEAFPGGTKIRYLFISAGEQVGVVVELPKDLVIQGAIKAASIPARAYSRIFFERDAKLVTEGKEMTFEAETILSQSALIESFPSGTRAKDGVHTRGLDGRSGGKIVFKAKRMSGQLEVILRGEDGGHGAPGAVMERAREGRHSLIELRKCEAPPAGFTGENGKTGNSGFGGGNGGDSGSVLIDIVDARELKLGTHLINGLGGRGGAGGPGQQGGLGGTRKIVFAGVGMCHHSFESNWSRGPEGSTGANGSAGASGKDGASGTCLDRKTKSVCIF